MCLKRNPVEFFGHWYCYGVMLGCIMYYALTHAHKWAMHQTLQLLVSCYSVDRLIVGGNKVQTSGACEFKLRNS